MVAGRVQGGLAALRQWAGNKSRTRQPPANTSHSERYIAHRPTLTVMEGGGEAASVARGRLQPLVGDPGGLQPPTGWSAGGSMGLTASIWRRARACEIFCWPPRFLHMKSQRPLHTAQTRPASRVKKRGKGLASQACCTAPCGAQLRRSWLDWEPGCPFGLPPWQVYARPTLCWPAVGRAPWAALGSRTR